MDSTCLCNLAIKPIRIGLKCVRNNWENGVQVKDW